MNDTTTNEASFTKFQGKKPVGFHLIDKDEAVRVSNLQTSFIVTSEQKYYEAVNYFLSLGSGYGTETINLKELI